jgi:signal transduction histidine kinase
MPHKPIPPPQPPGDHTDELLAMVAHELRRPLTALLGALATIQQHDQALSALQQQELLGMARQQGEQLRRLLGQLLAAAGVDRGQARLARRSLVDAVTLTAEAGRAAMLAHPDHPITIEVAGPLLSVLTRWPSAASSVTCSTTPRLLPPENADRAVRGPGRRARGAGRPGRWPRHPARRPPADLRAI